MNDRTIVYSTYYNAMEANIIRAKLEDSGFSCFLADENVATINPLYNQAIGGIKLIVFERDVENINQLLVEDNSTNLDLETENFPDANDGSNVCEKCGSTNVSYGTATKEKYGLFANMLSFITFSPPVVAKKCFHCYDCGHEFN
ncbi:DUF2007 domain-containing protein [Pedobacter frigidisoli]|uniref:DUF2007 domain-containing protein n=1 Tax=Pedobacter frigidisoli TaxID=2530455 RepID=A0A4R0P4I3_9SPHI|nr:DUF2007 domain-containing protein [Pedobacter frigidisoli]TCD10214.1 DUF2007 domain-containing protein [Pedobacter frigidisoli]